MIRHTHRAKALVILLKNHTSDHGINDLCFQKKVGQSLLQQLMPQLHLTRRSYSEIHNYLHTFALSDFRLACGVRVAIFSCVDLIVDSTIRTILTRDFQTIYYFLPERATDVTENFSSIESQGFYVIVSLLIYLL